MPSYTVIGLCSFNKISCYTIISQSLTQSFICSVNEISNSDLDAVGQRYSKWWSADRRRSADHQLPVRGRPEEKAQILPTSLNLTT